jgi:hypothetical protein
MEWTDLKERVYLCPVDPKHDVFMVESRRRVRGNGKVVGTGWDFPARCAECGATALRQYRVKEINGLRSWR